MIVMYDYSKVNEYIRTKYKMEKYYEESDEYEYMQYCVRRKGCHNLIVIRVNECKGIQFIYMDDRTISKEELGVINGDIIKGTYDVDSIKMEINDNNGCLCGTISDDYIRWDSDEAIHNVSKLLEEWYYRVENTYEEILMIYPRMMADDYKRRKGII